MDGFGMHINTNKTTKNTIQINIAGTTRLFARRFDGALS